jgi:predicted CoA-binding protein
MAVELNEKDEAIRDVLVNASVIAVVGVSKDHYYSSYQVATYLMEMGYLVYPVNPNIDELDGHRSYPTLLDVPAPIDIVDVFRKADYLPEVVDEAIAVGAKTVWGQLDVVDVNNTEIRKALRAGLNIATNLCIRAEHERLKIPPKQK